MVFKEELNIIKDVFVRPVEFFSKLDEKNIKKSFLHYLKLTLFYLVVAFIIGVSVSATLLLISQNSVDFSSILLSILVSLSLLGLYFIAGGFVFALLLSVWIAIFGGGFNYVKTYNLFAYSFTPSLLYGMIWGVGNLAYIHSLIILIIGTKEQYKFSTLKSILMYVIPLVVLVVLLFIFLISAFFMVVS